MEMRNGEVRYPDGHYYSPIPSKDDVAQQIARFEKKSGDYCPEIQLQQDTQFSLL